MVNEANRTLIGNVVSHLTTHHKYMSFEIHYLEFTKEFYLNELGENAASIKNAKEFFQKLDQRVEYEVALSQEVLCVSSWSVVRETTEKALMEGRGELLANDGAPAYVHDARTLLIPSLPYASVKKLLSRYGYSNTNQDVQALHQSRRTALAETILPHLRLRTRFTALP